MLCCCFALYMGTPTLNPEHELASWCPAGAGDMNGCRVLHVYVGIVGILWGGTLPLPLKSLGLRAEGFLLNLHSEDALCLRMSHNGLCFNLKRATIDIDIHICI